MCLPGKTGTKLSKRHFDVLIFKRTMGTKERKRLMNVKKLIAIALTLILVFSLAACNNGGGKTDDSNDEIRDALEVDVEPVAAPDEETPVIEPSEEEPPDGTGSDESNLSSRGDTSGDWPDNEFTRQVPKPDFAIITIVSNDSVFSAEFEIITEEQALTYAEQLIAAGFTPVRVGDSHHDKGERYRLDTDNAAGYSLVFTWLPNTTNLMINRLGQERGIDVGR